MEDKLRELELLLMKHTVNGKLKWYAHDSSNYFTSADEC